MEEGESMEKVVKVEGWGRDTEIPSESIFASLLPT